MQLFHWTRNPSQVAKIAQRKEEVYDSIMNGMQPAEVPGSRGFLDTLRNYNVSGDRIKLDCNLGVPLCRRSSFPGQAHMSWLACSPHCSSVTGNLLLVVLSRSCLAVPAVEVLHLHFFIGTEPFSFGCVLSSRCLLRLQLHSQSAGSSLPLRSSTWQITLTQW